MIVASAGNRAKRARIYFRLMDVVFILAVLGFSEFLLDKVGGIILMETSHPAHGYVSAFFIIMNFFLPMFLILARFMRDEYAEQVWRRTAVSLSYVVTLLPIAIFAGAWIDFLTTTTGQPRPLFALLENPIEPFKVVQVCWMAFMLLFVGVFQFLRWRDNH